MSKYSLIILVAALIGCGQEIPPEFKAVDIVKSSHALGGDLPVETTIENWLKDNKDEVKPIGWDASRKDDHTYLVSFAYEIYSWDKGSGEESYFFLVNLTNESVQNVTNILKRETKPLSLPFKDEKEVSDQMMQQFLQKEKILTGENVTPVN